MFDTQRAYISQRQVDAVTQFASSMIDITNRKL